MHYGGMCKTSRHYSCVDCEAAIRPAAKGESLEVALALGGDYFGRLHALGSAGGFKLHLLAFDQRLESFSLNRREVNEHVVTAISRGDKTKTFCIIEPLYITTLHKILFTSLFKKSD